MSSIKLQPFVVLYFFQIVDNVHQSDSSNSNLKLLLCFLPTLRLHTLPSLHLLLVQVCPVTFISHLTYQMYFQPVCTKDTDAVTV